MAIDLGQLITNAGGPAVVFAAVWKVIAKYQKNNVARSRVWEKSITDKTDSLEFNTRALTKELGDERHDRTDLKIELKSTMMRLNEHNRALEKILVSFQGNVTANKEKLHAMETEVLQLKRELLLVRTKKKIEDQG